MPDFSSLYFLWPLMLWACAAVPALALVYVLKTKKRPPMVLGLGLLLLSRLMDGLDGTVARLTRPTDAGGFLDIALDFLFYAAMPLAFAWADPVANALPAAVLLASFMGTGSSFLAFEVLAEKRQLGDTALPGKSFYFLGGLTEATETIAVFAAMCWWPQHFAILAYGFSVLCGITTAMRVVWGYQKLKSLP